MRAIISTFVGESIDSVIFFPFAFGGIIVFRDLLILMITQIIMKSMYEVILLPITIKVVKTLKHIEGMDTYDDGISYNIWKLNQI